MEKRLLAGWLALGALAWACTRPATPVPVVGNEVDLARLVGEWEW